MTKMMVLCFFMFPLWTLVDSYRFQVKAHATIPSPNSIVGLAGFPKLAPAAKSKKLVKLNRLYTEIKRQDARERT